MNESSSLRFSLPGVFLVVLGCVPLYAQSGLRQTLEKMDKNENGEIDPEEITPRARPYLERIASARRLSLSRPVRIDSLQEAARLYYAIQNGVSGKNIRPEGKAQLKSFEPDSEQPIVPGFGLAEVRYRYLQRDLDRADQTIRRCDKNRDGFIDVEEAARNKWTHRNPFEMDLDKDNRLSRMELAQRYARRRMLDGDADELVQRARRVGSGIRPSRLTSDEIRRRQKEEYAARRRESSRYRLTSDIMEHLDANRNGRLEQAEAQNLGVPAGRIDSDRDGELSRTELHAYFSVVQEEATGPAGLPPWFYERDLDRDKQVTLVEFADQMTEEKLDEFAALDLNNDGLLTITEVTQAKSAVGGEYLNQEALPIPPQRTVVSELEVEEDYPIGDLDVKLSITHSYISYLDVYLIGPDGQKIELFTAIGGSDDNFKNTVFDDQSRYSITRARAPYEGAFQPEGLAKRQPSLAHFNGKSVRGVWRLVIQGTRNNRFGLLHGWGLAVKPLGEEQIETEQSSPEKTDGAGAPSGERREEEVAAQGREAEAKQEWLRKMEENKAKWAEAVKARAEKEKQAQEKKIKELQNDRLKYMRKLEEVKQKKNDKPKVKKEGKIKYEKP